jgi:hypothetical protein
VVGLYDRAFVSVMAFAFERIGTVVAMRVEDYYPKGKRWWVRGTRFEIQMVALEHPVWIWPTCRTPIPRSIRKLRSKNIFPRPNPFAMPRRLPAET